jgi:hypothetical protein
VGKYYWAKEGFDCLDESGVARMKARLAALVRSKGLPVREWEVDRLNHVYDVALFRRDLKVPVYRDRGGYYALERDAEHPEEFLLPVGKAFLLASDPWDGYKVIYTGTPRRGVLSDRSPTTGRAKPCRNPAPGGASFGLDTKASGTAWYSSSRTPRTRKSWRRSTT